MPTKEQCEANRENGLAAVMAELSSWDGSSGSWYWLSFADPNKPAGTQFNGACIVQAPSELAAVAVASARGCNPHGEVVFLPIPDSLVSEIADKWKYRVLDRQECEAFDTEIEGRTAR